MAKQDQITTEADLNINAPDIRFCRLRGRFSILWIWLVQLLPWLRFRVLHVDAERNWA
jgi:hypothetical protein